MKLRLTIVLVFFIQIANAQLDMPAALRQNLAGKTKFEDIKTSINQFYSKKLATINVNDSSAQKGIMRQLKKWNRQFWLSEFYTNSDGIVQDKNKIDAEAYRKFQNNNNAFTNNASRQNTNWINQGPFNTNKGIGRVDKIAFHPTNPNVMYAGSPHGGLYNTNDGGNNWAPLSANLPSLGISGIVIDPNNPNIIYVLTGDANTGGGCFLGDAGCGILGQELSASKGVFKSTNGGSTWQQTGTLAIGIYRGSELVMDPTNSNILLAATSVGLYRTINAGNTWQLVESGNTFDVKYKPGNGNTVYITQDFYSGRSTDGGLTFNQMSTPSLLSYRRAIAVTPANPNKVIVFGGSVNADSSAYTGGIFSSTDDGQNFVPKNTAIDLFSRTDGSVGATTTGGQYEYNICIAISPTNENIIYTGGLCVWASINGGSSWSRKSDYWNYESNFMHPDIHELKFNPNNNNLFCGNDGGVYSYNGTSWDQKYRGLIATQFYHFERENDDEKIWGGAQDNGIIRQTIGADYELYKFGDGYDMMTDNEYLVFDGEADDVYFTVNNAIYKDDGNSVVAINVSNNNQFFGNLAMSPLEEDKIYVGYQNGVYRSLNAGSNWNIIGGSGNWCISSCRNDDFRLYAAGSGAGADRLFRYNLSAFAVDPITPPAPYNNNLKITDIDVDPVNSNNIWISVGGTQANAKVFYSDNGGSTWTNYTFNLPNVPIFCIKKDASYGLYVGTSIGVFYSSAANSYWEPFSNGLPPTPVTEIELWPEPNPVNNFVPSYAPSANPEIWISTFGRGIWYTKQSSSICPANIGLTGNVSGVMLSEAGNSILSNQQLTGGVGTNVKYNASQSILLTDGFFAPEGTRFQTYTTGCGNQIDLNRMKHLKKE